MMWGAVLFLSIIGQSVCSREDVNDSDAIRTALSSSETRVDSVMR